MPHINKCWKGKCTLYTICIYYAKPYSAKEQLCKNQSRLDVSCVRGAWVCDDTTDDYVDECLKQ